MAGGRTYTVPFSAVAVTAAQDLIEITPADDKPIAIIGWDIGQTSDSGDAQDEQLQLSCTRGNTTSGSGGSAPTPAPLDGVDTAAGFTAEVNNTTVASSGTGVLLYTSAFNVRSGTGAVFLPPEAYLRASQANTTIRMTITAPTDSLTMSGTFWVMEV